MANVETKSRRYAMNIHSQEAGATYEHIFYVYERRLDYQSRVSWF